MRPILPAVGTLAVALTGEAAGTALGIPDPVPFLLVLAGMGAGVGAFVVLHADAVVARRDRARRRAQLHQAILDSRRTLRLLEHCTDEELARLREVRRQVHQGARTEFPTC